MQFWALDIRPFFLYAQWRRKKAKIFFQYTDFP